MLSGDVVTRTRNDRRFPAKTVEEGRLREGANNSRSDSTSGKEADARCISGGISSLSGSSRAGPADGGGPRASGPTYVRADYILCQRCQDMQVRPWSKSSLNLLQGTFPPNLSPASSRVEPFPTERLGANAGTVKGTPRAERLSWTLFHRRLGSLDGLRRYEVVAKRSIPTTNSTSSADGHVIREHFLKLSRPRGDFWK